MRVCLKLLVAAIRVIEMSTVSHIWIYFNVLKGHKKDEYTRKKGVHYMIVQDTGAKKEGGAQEHLHVFHKIPPSVFLVSFMSILFHFLFIHSSISAWRGMGLQ